MNNSRRLILGLVGLIVLSGLPGCRIKGYMVPLIVKGELDKMKTQKAHEVENYAEVLLGEATEEVNFTVRYSPPSRYRYEYRPVGEGSEVILCVSDTYYTLYSPGIKQMIQVVGLPSFADSTFTEFRKKALYTALRYNQAEVIDDPADPKKYWKLITQPNADSPWQMSSESYIVKDSRNNVRIIEKDSSGNVIGRFETLKKSFDVNFTDDLFTIHPTEDTTVWTFDLSTGSPMSEYQGQRGRKLPAAFEGLNLSRFQESPEQALFDYTTRQMVLFYAQILHENRPVLRSPVRREISLNGTLAAVSYAGYYSTCTWRSDEWEHLIFTTLGPEVAITLAQTLLASPVTSAQENQTGQTPLKVSELP